jgi:hypothetical protein
MTAEAIEADPSVLPRFRGDAWEQLERELDRMTEDEEAVDELRELYGLRRGKAPQFPGLTAADVLCGCAGAKCGRLLIAAGTLGSRRRMSVPPEVAARVNGRPFCRSCAKGMGVELAGVGKPAVYAV